MLCERDGGSRRWVCAQVAEEAAESLSLDQR